MACEVASPTPSYENVPLEEWINSAREYPGLDAVAAFNASFNNNGDISGQHDGSGGIDPRLLTNASSSANILSTAGSGTKPTDKNAGMFGRHPSPTVNGLRSSAAPSPYFHQSIEGDSNWYQQSFYAPSPLRNQLHRRSVSEPPDQHHLPVHMLRSQHPPSPVFTRSGMPLGTPCPSIAAPPLRQPKVRQPVYRQPFSVVKRQAPRQERHQLRRANTQPSHILGGPTSVPPGFRQSPGPPPRMMMPPPPSMLPPTPMVTTRVCTPAPSPEPMASRVQIDPRLASAAPAMREMPELTTAATPIARVTVEELKAIIKDAVQEAVRAAVGTTGENRPAAETLETTTGMKMEATGGDTKDNEENMQLAVGNEDIRRSIEGDNILWQ